jgi:hypothetical protein
VSKLLSVTTAGAYMSWCKRRYEKRFKFKQ